MSEFQSKLQIFKPNAQVLRPNVRKRLKTFENIRKLSKNDVKRSITCVKYSKIFKFFEGFCANGAIWMCPVGNRVS